MHLFHLGYWLMVNNLVSAVKFKNKFFFHVWSILVCVCVVFRLTFCLSPVPHPVIRNLKSGRERRAASIVLVHVMSCYKIQTVSFSPLSKGRCIVKKVDNNQFIITITQIPNK